MGASVSGPTDDAGIAAAGARGVAEPEGQPVYFVMTDRFANGDASNDRGGLAGGRDVTGFDPTDPGYFHGGDFAGLTQRLDYIKGLGMEAIWVTPVVRNLAVQGEGADASAAYHGYWGLDFTSVDPHLGSEQAVRAFVDAAHQRGLKVYLDVVVNHTADVLRYNDGDSSYLSAAGRPWLDASGNPVDVTAVADSPKFPQLTLKSFPHQPVPRDSRLADAKKPAWLNDPTAYHNRGNSTYSGESTQWGDIAGLDDLFTEEPRVLTGMTDIVTSWVDRLRVDGLRLDTVKHVNPEFWRAFVPAVTAKAASLGIAPFYVFGEVLDPDPLNTSPWVKRAGVPEVLDFPFQSAAVSYATGGDPADLATLFDADDDYTDVDSDAGSLATFLGNHDLGRVGAFLEQGTLGEKPSMLMSRDALAHDLLFLSRGNPVVYYGDEQGFVGGDGGDIGDKAARQDMFATRVPSWAKQPRLDGRPIGAAGSFDPSAPLYRHIAGLAALTREHPALRRGVQVTRLAQSPQGIFAFSRYDEQTGIEDVVVLNSSLRTQRAEVPTYSPGLAFRQIYANGAAVSSSPSTTSPSTTSPGAALAVTVPALGALVYEATAPVAAVTAAPGVAVSAPAQVAGGSGSVDLTARVTGPAAGAPVRVTFAWRRTGSRGWQLLGSDGAPPYRVSVPLAGVARGSWEVRAVALARGGSPAGTSATMVVQ
ncbi:MAG: alpha-amylase family glycosyl hydrolase [Actinomycetes bacterium]